jgi:hypothetical protein
LGRKSVRGRGRSRPRVQGCADAHPLCHKGGPLLIRSVGGAGGRQIDGLRAGFRGAERVEQVRRFFSRREDRRDLARRKQGPEQIGHGISDAAVRGALYLAGVQHIPQGDVISQKKRGSRGGVGRGRLLPQDSGQGGPETILRMRVIEARCPRLGRGKGSEDQNPRTRIVYRIKRVFQHIHI